MSKQRLYIDESGDHIVRGVTESQWDKRYLCLLGCQLEEDYCRRTFVPAMEAFKKKHFGDEFDEPVILHREDIAAKTPPFHVLKEHEKNRQYCAELLRFVEDARFIAYAVVIDKIEPLGKPYGLGDSNPYHNGLLAMLEQYCGELRSSGNIGDVLAEGRGKREDGLLKAAYRAIYDGGSGFRPPSFFQRHLATAELKVKPKLQNICGLQLADLLAYPAKIRMLEEKNRNKPATGFTKDMADILDKKFSQRWVNQQSIRYGKVWLF